MINLNDQFKDNMSSIVTIQKIVANVYFDVTIESLSVLEENIKYQRVAWDQLSNFQKTHTKVDPKPCSDEQHLDRQTD